jgi:hypothetical protein
MAIGKSRLHEVLKNATRLSDLEAWFTTFDGETKVKIVDWIREDQLRDEGIDSQGDMIGTYSYTTELITNGAKQEGEPYSLYDTGAFYRSMYMVVLNDAIVFEGDTTKIEDQDWWSQNIMNLTDENRLKLKELVKRNYIGCIRKILYGTI